jgi:tetratricopeptide (TPR) repeat protein
MLRFVAALALLAFALASALAAETPLETARRIKQQGTPGAAAIAYEAALPALRSAADRSLLAQALVEAAQASLAAADYNRAFERAEEAATSFRTLKDAAGEAGALNTAGSAQLFRGQYEAALALIGQALALDRQHGDAQGEASCLGNIGNVYFYQGKYLDALESYQAALRRIDAAGPQPWAAARRPIALTNLALLQEQLGEEARALEYYRQTLASEISPAERGQVLSNIGTLYRRQGAAAKALESYDSAGRLFTQEHLSAAAIHTLQSAGITHALDPRDTAGAARSFNEALRMAQAGGDRREIALAHLFRGEAFYRAGDLAAAGIDFEAALATARAAGATAEHWTALYGIARIARRRGDTAAALARLRETIAIIEMPRPTRPGPSLEPDFLPDTRDVYDAAIGLLLESPARDTAQLFRWIEQAGSRNRRDALRSSTAPPTLAAVQQRLSEGSALVEFWIGDGRLAALWITRGGSGIVDRAWTQADDTAVRAFAARLRTVADGSWRSDAPPLLQGIPWQSVRRVAIVPDGVLYLLPFEALPLGSGLLIERMPVSYLPSASLLFRDPSRHVALPPWRSRLMAFGEPAELQGVARALPGRAALFPGPENLKRRMVSTGLTGVPLLHLASPATQDLTDSNRSRIRFTAETGHKGSEYLFRAEAQALELDGADLVTLSSCETTAGPVTRPEGTQSFSRAFLAAGARATATTLWPVEARHTTEFMEMFYGNLGRGLARDEALRDVKLRFLQQGGERARPHVWAAFLLNGDADSPVRPVLSWLRVLVIAAVAIALAGLYFRRRYQRRSGTSPGENPSPSLTP